MPLVLKILTEQLNLKAKEQQYPWLLFLALSLLPLTCGTHTSDSSSTLNPSDPRRRRRARRTWRRPVLPLRRGRRRASRRTRRALRQAPAAAAVKRAPTRTASSATGRTLRRTPAPALSRAASSAAGRALRRTHAQAAVVPAAARRACRALASIHGLRCATTRRPTPCTPAGRRSSCSPAREHHAGRRRRAVAHHGAELEARVRRGLGRVGGGAPFQPRPRP